jgi:DEAD/DEAH box helicase domain-containing protein
MLQIAEYCCFDVKCTKLVHEYGAQHRRVQYFDKQQQKKSIGVDWTMEC